MNPRECFYPREGKVFASADIDQLELRTLSQVCLKLFGKSKLADVLNQGLDPHTLFACEQILNIPYAQGLLRRKDKEDKEFDTGRKIAKVANFGLPGGLGPKTFIEYAKGYNLKVSEQQARQIRNDWRAQWPEMSDYFAHIETLKNPETGLYDVVQLFSNRLRGGCRYTAACNTYFQGLGADATHRGGWYLARACYAERESVLFGSRVVNYIHDEFILEVPEEKADPCAREMTRLMLKGINEYLPDVPATAEPLLMSYWSKMASTILDEKGLLVPWPQSKN